LYIPPASEPFRSETLVSTSDSKQSPKGRYLALLAVGALGIVYGDIGTSPLYAFRESFHGQHGIPVTPGNVLGVLSLMFWALILIVTYKYHVVIIKADNKGEGGILALMALVQGNRVGRGLPPIRIMTLLGIFGTALMYADGALTPAISVMSAVEGLNVATPALATWVLPLTLVILLVLFFFQRHGTGRIASVFGPIMLLWFLTLAILGITHIVLHPGVLAAMSPHHGIRFFIEDPARGLLVLGAVFLVVTGGEALYADLGHFGHTPIQFAWFTVALPALVLNYFGQGALLLTDPAAAENPFFHMAPSWALYPLIALATAAAIIASQAVISGAFSLTRQAIQLGYSPRVEIQHTSSREMGQIYVPAVNWMLMIMTCALVLAFRSSSNIAGAYGVALSSLMVMTTVMFAVMAHQVWHWSLAKTTIIASIFLLMDVPFLVANGLKIVHGGWVPLAIAAVIFLLQMTWKKGRVILSQRLAEHSVPIQILLGDIAAEPPIRVPGTAIFMTAQPDGVPYTLLYNLRHNQVLHERVVLMTVVMTEVPRVPNAERVVIEPMAQGFFRVTARYGFMDEPDVHEILDRCGETIIPGTPPPPDAELPPVQRASSLSLPGMPLAISVEAATFFVGRETIIASNRPGMAIWREKLFSLMSRNTPRITTTFNIPVDQVIEIGAQIEL
jgi:KUP system potassium uptake protein